MPPNVPGIPGLKLPARAELESVRSSRAETEDFQREVHAHYGKASFRGPAWVFGVIALIALCVGATYYLDHRDSGASDCASKSDLNALDKHVSEIAASVRDLTYTIGRNADQAHNDTSAVSTELHSYINSHAK